MTSKFLTEKLKNVEVTEVTARDNKWCQKIQQSLLYICLEQCVMLVHFLFLKYVYVLEDYNKRPKFLLMNAA